jgi:hypothetical protein
MGKGMKRTIKRKKRQMKKIQRVKIAHQTAPARMSSQDTMQQHQKPNQTPCVSSIPSQISASHLSPSQPSLTSPLFVSSLYLIPFTSHPLLRFTLLYFTLFYPIPSYSLLSSTFQSSISAFVPFFLFPPARSPFLVSLNIPFGF